MYVYRKSKNFPLFSDNNLSIRNTDNIIVEEQKKMMAKQKFEYHMFNIPKFRINDPSQSVELNHIPICTLPSNYPDKESAEEEMLSNFLLTNIKSGRESLLQSGNKEEAIQTVCLKNISHSHCIINSPFMEGSNGNYTTSVMSRNYNCRTVLLCFIVNEKVYAILFDLDSSKTFIQFDVRGQTVGAYLDNTLDIASSCPTVNVAASSERSTDAVPDLISSEQAHSRLAIMRSSISLNLRPIRVSVDSLSNMITPEGYPVAVGTKLFMIPARLFKVVRKKDDKDGLNKVTFKCILENELGYTKRSQNPSAGVKSSKDSNDARPGTSRGQTSEGEA